MAKEKSIGGIQIGTSFLVLIFVVLALVIFSVLSLLSALSDNKLTEKNEAAVMAFYQADSLAEEKLAKIDKSIISAGSATGEGSFEERLSKLLGDIYDPATGIVSYGVPISENLMIFVDIEVLPDSGDSVQGKNYKILRWQEENVSEYEIDDSLHVWMGDE